MYLLKVKYKSAQSIEISIKLKNVYKEFECLGELIRFLFIESNFIEDFKIYEMNEIYKKQGFIDLSEGNINLSA